VGQLQSSLVGVSFDEFEPELDSLNSTVNDLTQYEADLKHVHGAIAFARDLLGAKLAGYVQRLSNASQTANRVSILTLELTRLD
jgi:hypothetical protein